MNLMHELANKSAVEPQTKKRRVSSQSDEFTGVTSSTSARLDSLPGMYVLTDVLFILEVYLAYHLICSVSYSSYLRSFLAGKARSRLVGGGEGGDVSTQKWTCPVCTAAGNTGSNCIQCKATPYEMPVESAASDDDLLSDKDGRTSNNCRESV